MVVDDDQGEERDREREKRKQIRSRSKGENQCLSMLTPSRILSPSPHFTSNRFFRRPARTASRDAPRSLASADKKRQRRRPAARKQLQQHLPSDTDRRRRSIRRRVRARGGGQRRRGLGGARGRVVSLLLSLCFAFEKRGREAAGEERDCLNELTADDDAQPFLSRPSKKNHSLKTKTAPSSTAPLGSGKENQEGKDLQPQSLSQRRWRPRWPSSSKQKSKERKRASGRKVCLFPLPNLDLNLAPLSPRRSPAPSASPRPRTGPRRARPRSCPPSPPRERSPRPPFRLREPRVLALPPPLPLLQRPPPQAGSASEPGLGCWSSLRRRRPEKLTSH